MKRIVKEDRLSLLLAVVCWISLIALTWLAILNVVPVDTLRVAGWLFFLITAIAASSLTLYQEESGKPASQPAKPVKRLARTIKPDGSS